MKLAIVAYPALDEADRQWIESLRTKYDPQASRIRAHFTLVFPFEGPPDELEQELTDIAKAFRPIRFSIRGTQVVADPINDVSCVFLVPDEGREEIARLHDRLYAGALRDHLRTDIAFVPHITVGVAPDSGAAETLAEAVGAKSRIVAGTLAQVELVDVGGPCVQSLAEYALGDPTRTDG